LNILAGDIGGTKTLLHIAEVRGTHIKVLHQARFASPAYRDFETLLGEFLDQAPPLLRNSFAGACFGVAGPVSGPEHGQRRASITNLPWQIDDAKLSKMLQLTRVSLINDFFATASGIEALRDEDLDVLSFGTAQSCAPRLVVGAGTGLGVAQLVWCDGRYRAFASEGGHGHFAPTDDLQVELLGHLRQRYDRVSNERLVSGGGLVCVHEFLMGRAGSAAIHTQPSPVAGDTAEAIVALARAGEPISRQALSLFLSIYGAVVGDLDLVSLAYGGVYIAGGIAPRLRAEMHEGGFMRAYGQKGRMSPLVRQMPVSIILSQDCGLRGASLIASRL
jgi:glucokinase